MTPEDYIVQQGFASWYVEHNGGYGGEVVINYQDCLQAMEEYADLCIRKLQNEADD